MIIRLGESQRLDATAGTFGGILFYANLVGSTNNIPIVPGDFLPAYVQVKTTLNRGGQSWSCTNDNLLNLATLSMRKSSYERMVNGFNLVPAGATWKEYKARVFFIEFASPISLRRTDILSLEVNMQQSAFGPALNSSISFLDAVFCPSVGREHGIPIIQSEIVQTNAVQQQFVNANGVRRIEFINYDKTSFDDGAGGLKNVLSSVMVGSDKINFNNTWQEAYAADFLKYPANQAYRFGTAPGTNDVFMNLPWLPQSLSIFAPGGGVLNNCSVTLSFNSPEVAASQNWVISERLVRSN